MLMCLSGFFSELLSLMNLVHAQLSRIIREVKYKKESTNIALIILLKILLHISK